MCGHLKGSNMVVGIVWAGVALVLGYLVIQEVRKVREASYAYQNRLQTADEKKAEVKLLERRNAAKLDEATADERAQLEKARLLRQAADEEAAAQVVRETVADRVAAERQVIEAAAEGRAERAKADALQAPSQPSDAALLVQAYMENVNHGGTNNITDWFGSDIELVDGKMRVEPS